MRWYYDDPLAAAWMAKHFAMSFQLGNDTGRTRSFYLLYRSINPMNPAIIHPDSLLLLEPQQWDVLRSMYWDTDGMDEDGVFLVESNEDIKSARLKLNAKTHYICERQGNPFHWPLQEEGQ